jgi:HD-GYP domain-containing protein (c-di-GMP phosphodiesterase class II)
LGIEIPLSARLFAVVDTFEALTHERPYAPARSAAEARDELVQVSGSQLDPHAVELFLGIDPDDWNRPSSAPPPSLTP